MFYSFGEQYAYNLLYTVAKPFFTRPVAELETADFKGAYQKWVAATQPALPAATLGQPECVEDAAREAALIQPLVSQSALDDRAVYKLADFGIAHGDRSVTARQAAHVRDQLAAFRVKDASYWEVFDLYVNYLALPSSKYTQGGTSSSALGVIYLVDPDKRNADTLYELLVHESTHLMMFVDERRTRHYRSDALLVDPANFSISAVYERLRPLDKALHSIAVAAEVLLHREAVLGHANESTIHPPTAKLAPSTLRACDALLELQARRQLLAPRGVLIVETCAKLLRDIVRPAHSVSAA
ncbi:MAG TPA: HEXXH motif-containing putative peptide modification protein [Kofleriaceae bacterium]|jgi:hypothetical protein